MRSMNAINNLEMIVEVKDIHFEYPTRPGALSFSLSVPIFGVKKGEQWMIVGPSGSGKSTILNLISGELVPSDGSVRVLGKCMNAMTYDERQAFRIENIGYVFQDFPLVPYLNALQNIVFPFRINPHLQLSEDVVERAHALLNRLGLINKHDRMPSELSQGERQRVAIARALIVKPKILLADEPTAGLDLHRSHAVMDLLESVATDEGAGLIVVSHEPQIVNRFHNVFDLSLLDRNGIDSGTVR